MKIEELQGEWVWVSAGSPMLFRSAGGGPSRVRHDRIVKVERIEPATATRPALAIWADAEGEYGVEARLVLNDVMNLPPSGYSLAAKAVGAIARRIKATRGR